jgi:hypothetical protein
MTASTVLARENSEVLLPPPVAVAVITCPAGTAGRVTVNGASPKLLVVTVVEPR